MPKHETTVKIAYCNPEEPTRVCHIVNDPKRYRGQWYTLPPHANEKPTVAFYCDGHRLIAFWISGHISTYHDQGDTSALVETAPPRILLNG